MSDQPPPPGSWGSSPGEPPNPPHVPPGAPPPAPPDGAGGPYAAPGPYPAPAGYGAAPPPYGGPAPYGAPPAYGAPAPYGAPVHPGLPAPGPALPLAHRGRRLLARMIDALIVGVLAGALITPLLILVTTEDPKGQTAWVGVGVLGSLIILFGGWILYEGLQLSRWGMTLGKRWLGLKVVSADPPGAPLTRGRAFGRAVTYPPGFIVVNVIPLLALLGTLNVLWQFWDKPYHQCLHDKIAGTVVIDGRG